MSDYSSSFTDKAFLRGYNDCKDATVGASCPYEYGTVEFTDWNLGWDKALEETKGATHD